jgi:S1-C subfamily serine protease
LAIVGLALGALLGLLGATASDALAGPSPAVAVLGRSADRVDDGVVERLRATTLSVTSTGCAGPVLGTGVATTGGLLVTAGHVAGGARRVHVTSSRRSATVSPVMTASPVDVASAPLPDGWPSVREAGADPAVGSTVVVATRARGRLRLRVARVQDYVAGVEPSDPSRVMRLDLGAEPGDSGGPVVDEHGRLVGIVYLRERISGRALVVPVRELDAALGGDAVAGRC